MTAPTTQAKQNVSDTDRHWLLTQQSARRALAVRSQTGRTQPLHSLSLERAEEVLSTREVQGDVGRDIPEAPPRHRPRPPTPGPRRALPGEATSVLPAIAPPPPPSSTGWMFEAESGRPSVLGADELAAATARPLAGLFRRLSGWLRR